MVKHLEALKYGMVHHSEAQLPQKLSSCFDMFLIMIIMIIDNDDADGHNDDGVHLHGARLMSCSFEQAGHPHCQVANLVLSSSKLWL